MASSLFVQPDEPSSDDGDNIIVAKTILKRPRSRVTRKNNGSQHAGRTGEDTTRKARCSEDADDPEDPDYEVEDDESEDSKSEQEDDEAEADYEIPERAVFSQDRQAGRKSLRVSDRRTKELRASGRSTVEKYIEEESDTGQQGTGLRGTKRKRMSKQGGPPRKHNTEIVTAEDQEEFTRRPRLSRSCKNTAGPSAHHDAHGAPDDENKEELGTEHDDGTAEERGVGERGSTTPRKARLRSRNPRASNAAASLPLYIPPHAPTAPSSATTVPSQDLANLPDGEVARALLRLQSDRLLQLKDEKIAQLEQQLRIASREKDRLLGGENFTDSIGLREVVQPGEAPANCIIPEAARAPRRSASKSAALSSSDPSRTGHTLIAAAGSITSTEKGATKQSPLFSVSENSDDESQLDLADDVPIPAGIRRIVAPTALMLPRDASWPRPQEPNSQQLRDLTNPFTEYLHQKLEEADRRLANAYTEIKKLREADCRRRRVLYDSDDYDEL